MMNDVTGLVIGYLHPGEVSHSFHHSMRGLMVHDLTHKQRIRGFIAEECGAGRITDGRNSVVRKFLALDAEWLGFVDADMGFDPDMFDRLIEAADPESRPIVGALAFAQRKGPDVGAGARRFQVQPTIYRWVDGQVAGVAPVYDYPKDALVACDATGAACFVIHRTVLEKLAEIFPAPRQWFDETVYKGQVFGEDVTFCRRAAENGFPIHVHTGVKTSHYKHTYLMEETFPDPTDVPTYVVIPMKNRMDLTRPLLRELERQGGYKSIFVFDNGSNRKNRNELDSLDVAGLEVFDADGLNIHQMWNRGIGEALSRDWPCNVAILNNDIDVGPNFLRGLSKPLRTDPLLQVVCPNYDGRPGSGVQYTQEICADRYDGTGGLAGFAFMLQGESGYRFPEELNWWYGDNHMIASVLYAGSQAGIVLDVTVEHVDGGGQTGGDWSDRQDQLEADRRWYNRWLRQASGQPETHVVVLWSGCDATERVLSDVAERFEVVDVLRLEWDDHAGRLGDFYQTDVTRKVSQAGSGPFTVAIVRDPHPQYADRSTTRGVRQVNVNLFDAKQQWRSMVSNPETVHASDDPDDAQANLAVLFPGHETLRDALDAIPCRHVVLRNFADTDGDVDVLVDDLQTAVDGLGAVKLHPEPYRVAYAVQVGGRWVPFDLRHVGDGYYDRRWQADILERRVLRDGMWTPCDDDWYWSLLYHALRHKGTTDRYRPVLDALRDGPHDGLTGWLEQQGYRYTTPDDLTVPLAGVIHGHVTSGYGAAERDVKAGWYDELGDLHPGTLNVACGPVRLPAPHRTIAVPDGRTMSMWRGTAGGVDVWVMVGGDSPGTVELLADRRLRDVLDVDDGDPLEVVVDG